ncbi:MAG: RNA polymerase sigma factor [Rhodothermaceae bacterium]
MTKTEEFEIIKAFIQGDESAFNKIVRKYQQQIYWQVRRMLGSHLDADEVTQEVLIVLYKKLNTFKFNSALSTWIYKITSTRTLNYIRKQKLRQFIGIEDENVAQISNGNDIVKSAEDKEKLEILENVLQKLPVKQREVFIYRKFDSLTYEEISEITGKSVGGLKASYFNAIKKVSELMDGKL